MQNNIKACLPHGWSPRSPSSSHFPVHPIVFHSDDSLCLPPHTFYPSPLSILPFCCDQIRMWLPTNHIRRSHDGGSERERRKIVPGIPNTNVYIYNASCVLNSGYLPLFFLKWVTKHLIPPGRINWTTISSTTSTYYIVSTPHTGPSACITFRSKLLSHFPSVRCL